MSGAEYSVNLQAGISAAGGAVGLTAAYVDGQFDYFYGVDSWQQSAWEHIMKLPRVEFDFEGVIVEMYLFTQQWVNDMIPVATNCPPLPSRLDCNTFKFTYMGR